MRAYRAQLAVMVALATGSAGLAALEPLLLRQLFDALTRANAQSVVLLGFACLAGLLLCNELLAAALDWLTWRVRLGLDYALMRGGVERLHTLPDQQGLRRTV